MLKLYKITVRKPEDFTIYSASVHNFYKFEFFKTSENEWKEVLYANTIYVLFAILTIRPELLNHTIKVDSDKINKEYNKDKTQRYFTQSLFNTFIENSFDNFVLNKFISL
jgi:hypothetical protein